MSAATIDSPLQSPNEAPAGDRAPAWYAGALTVAAVVGTWLTMPWATFVMAQMSDAPAQEPTMAGRVYGTIVTALVCYVLVRLGIGLGRSLGLGWPALRPWRAPHRAVGRLRDSLALSVLVGIALAALRVGLGELLPVPDPESVDFSPPPWYFAFLASIGAGINEEILLRLGVMTVLASGIARLARGTASPSAIAWTANVMAALVFGAMHLPQAFAFGPVTVWVLTFVLLGNGVVGVACGWLYWRVGIVAAMVSHAVVDVVLKVLLPLAAPVVAA